MFYELWFVAEAEGLLFSNLNKRLKKFGRIFLPTLCRSTLLWNVDLGLREKHRLLKICINQVDQQFLISRVIYLVLLTLDCLFADCTFSCRQN